MKNRTFFPSTLLLGSASLLVAVLAAPAPALAEFQWFSPSATDSGQVASPSGQAALPSTVITSPLVTADTPAKTIELPMVAEPAAAPAPVVPAVPERIVHGFANNVPLSIALRQILPPDHGFSVSLDVNLSTLVSWRGEKPWHQSLDEMLQTAGLVAQDEGQMVHIVHASAAKTATAAPAPAVTQPATKVAVVATSPAPVVSAVAPTPAPVPVVKEIAAAPAPVAPPVVKEVAAVPLTTPAPAANKPVSVALPPYTIEVTSSTDKQAARPGASPEMWVNTKGDTLCIRFMKPDPAAPAN